MNNCFMVCLLTCVLPVFAEGPSSSFSAAINFAKAQHHVAENQMKQFNPETTFQHYQKTPEQTHYYQGVTQTHSDLMDQGQRQFSTTGVGQTVIETLRHQPDDSISKTSSLVSNGTLIKAHAEAITTGKYKGCHQKVIRKNYFTEHQCVQGKVTTVPCNENSTIEWHQRLVPVVQQEKVNLGGTTVTYTSKTKGIITAVYVQGDLWKHHHGGYFSFTVNGHAVPLNTVNEVHHYYDHRGIYRLTDQYLPSPGYIIHTTGNYGGNVTIVLTLRVQKTVWKPEVIWQTQCPFDTSLITEHCNRTKHTCVIPGGTRVTTDGHGQVEKLYRDCWGYQDRYQCGQPDPDTCSQWQHDPDCNIAVAHCTEYSGALCVQQKVIYLCQQSIQMQGLLCGEQFYCLNGECDTAHSTHSQRFAPAVSRLAAAANAAHSAATSKGPVLHAFTGQVLSCRYDGFDFSNCCADSGWGKDIGLAHCNDEEKKLGLAKEKQLTVKAGTRCDRKILGQCVAHSKVYCVFGSLLATLIQTQGRARQLGIGFGSGKHPDCSGLTPEQLQHIDFNRIDFSPFYPDLKQQLHIPDSAQLVNRIRQRIQPQLSRGKGGEHA